MRAEILLLRAGTRAFSKERGLYQEFCPNLWQNNGQLNFRAIARCLPSPSPVINPATVDKLQFWWIFEGRGGGNLSTFACALSQEERIKLSIALSEPGPIPLSSGRFPTMYSSRNWIVPSETGRLLLRGLDWWEPMGNLSLVLPGVHSFRRVEEDIWLLDQAAGKVQWFLYGWAMMDDIAESDLTELWVDNFDKLG